MIRRFGINFPVWSECPGETERSIGEAENRLQGSSYYARGELTNLLALVLAIDAVLGNKSVLRAGRTTQNTAG